MIRSTLEELIREGYLHTIRKALWPNEDTLHVQEITEPLPNITGDIGPVLMI